MQGIETAIPVLRMMDTERTLAFYTEVLGFAVDWTHTFSPSSPTYAQVSHGGARVHLDGHADEKTPPSQVRFPMEGLEEYCRTIRERCPSTMDPPELVDPRYTGRPTEMNIVDPSGNLLMFWTQRR